MNSEQSTNQYTYNMQQTYQDLERTGVDECLKLKSLDTYTTRTLGEVFVISVSQNNLPCFRDALTRKLMHKEVILDDKLRRVVGIEMFAAGDTYEHETITLMVKEIT